MEAYLDNPKLNEQQLDMLRLFKNPMPEESFLQIKRLVVQLLGKQLDEIVGQWEEKENRNF